jgi:hypothetical protein
VSLKYALSRQGSEGFLSIMRIGRLVCKVNCEPARPFNDEEKLLTALVPRSICLGERLNVLHEVRDHDLGTGKMRTALIYHIFWVPARAI